MRGGLLCSLGCRRNTDLCRAIGQRHDLLFNNDLLDLLEPILVEGQNRISHELLLLQLVHHIAVIARR